MSDYIIQSRFDNIDFGSDDEAEDNRPAGPLPPSVFNTDSAAAAMGGEGEDIPDLSSSGKLKPVKQTQKTSEGRMKYEYEGRTIYEWEQSLEECNIYIGPPPGVPRSVIEIVITYNHLTVGIKDTPPFIDEDIFRTVKPDESYWMMSDGEININLQKMKKGEVNEEAHVYIFLPAVIEMPDVVFLLSTIKPTANLAFFGSLCLFLSHLLPL